MIRKLTAADVTFEIEALPEDCAIEGNAIASGDDEYDAEVNAKIREDLEAGNEWAWCCVKVTARWKDWSGVDYLGGCSYASKADFEKDAYCDDMKDRALDELNAEIARDAAALAELCEVQ